MSIPESKFNVLKSTSKKNKKKQPTSLSVAGSSPSLILRECPVHRAVTALRNSAAVESKGFFGAAGKSSGADLVKGAICTPQIFAPEIVAALRGMFNSRRTYDFQIHTAFTLTTSAAGAMLDISPISPASTSYYEWAALAALFDEVKAVSSTVEICAFSSVGSVGALLPLALVLAVDEQNINTAVSSYTAVQRLAGSRTFCLPYGDAGSGRHVHSHVFASRAWANTATPATQSPIGGMVGSWSMANGNPGSNSSNYGLFNQIVRVRLRARA